MASHFISKQQHYANQPEILFPEGFPNSEPTGWLPEDFQRLCSTDFSTKYPALWAVEDKDLHDTKL